MIKFVLVKKMFGKEMIPMVFRGKTNYDEYKVNSTWSWGVSSLFFYPGYNKSNFLGKYFFSSTIPDNH
jgi:hypothetical protein